MLSSATLDRSLSKVIFRLSVDERVDIEENIFENENEFENFDAWFFWQFFLTNFDFQPDICHPLDPLGSDYFLIECSVWS